MPDPHPSSDVLERLRSESLHLFPQRMRDGHAYHSTAFVLDKAASLIEAQDATIERLSAQLEQAARVENPMTDWQPIEDAPKDGAWILLRGRNSLGYPMIPVVCSWRSGEGGGPQAWRDSASGLDMGSLIADVPSGDSADWMPVPK